MSQGYHNSNQYLVYVMNNFILCQELIDAENAVHNFNPNYPRNIGQTALVKMAPHTSIHYSEQYENLQFFF